MEIPSETGAGDVVTNREIVDRLFTYWITADPSERVGAREALTAALDAKDREREHAVCEAKSIRYPFDWKNPARDDAPHVCTMVAVEWNTHPWNEGPSTTSQVTKLACTAPDCGRTKAVGP